jgi:hypothetical protein
LSSNNASYPASNLRLTIVLLLILFEIPSPEIPDGGGIILYIAGISQYKGMIILVQLIGNTSYGMNMPPFT